MTIYFYNILITTCSVLTKYKSRALYTRIIRVYLFMLFNSVFVLVCSHFVDNIGIQLCGVTEPPNSADKQKFTVLTNSAVLYSFLEGEESKTINN